MNTKPAFPFQKTGMRVSAVLFLFLLFFLSAFRLLPGRKVEPGASLEAFTTYLGERIPGLMDRYDIPGIIVALVRDGEPAWAGAYGYAELAAGRKMTTDTYCRVESISKPVTAWGVMKLVQEGKVELDAPVARYLKSWAFPASEYPVEEATVRQLLSHTAGLQLGTIGVRYDPKGEVPTLKEALTKDAHLMQAPGQGYSYSNTGFNILELLIEEVTGRGFAEYMQNEVLLPLGMEHSTFTWRESLQPPVPDGHDLQGKPIPPYIYPDKAAGGLFATVGDIAAFAAAGMTEHAPAGFPVLDAPHIQQLYEPMVEGPAIYGLAFDSYGLGYFIEWLPTGQKAVSHGGQGSGWMTHLHAVPETGDAIIIFSNSQRSWPFFAYILNDWAEWNGFSSVGMGKIVLATKILWVLITLLFALSAWQLWRVGRSAASGQRRLAPLAKDHWLLRLLQAGLFVILMAVLLWALSQDYLFIASVFPVAAGWLGWAVFAVAVALLGVVLYPQIRKDDIFASNIVNKR